MFYSHITKIPELLLEGNGAKGVSKRAVLGPKEGWPDYVMRYFEVSPGGHTPRHTHPYPHYVFVVEGRGTLHYDGVDQPVEKGTVTHVAANSLHQFSSTEKEKLCFICIVPREGEA